jgi:multiple antibiotic resistance protein
MDRVVDFAFTVDTFLLLLIGVGPKIALVPFLEVTEGLDEGTKRRVTRKMLLTVAIVAVLLLALGELLTRLLHFSPGSLSIAGGLVLLIIAILMILGIATPESSATATKSDPMLLAVSPLAIPYLLNPAGIVALVTLSAESDSPSTFGVVFGLLALVLIIDVVVFRWANRVSQHLDESRMLVAEKVFGFLLAALGVQLVLNGLSDTGVIHLTGH